MEPHGQVGGESHRPDHGGVGQSAVNMNYVPTEDERRVFRECNEESFWYRSLPMSAMGMLVTQMLIKKGILSTHSRFGSFPKLAFAGLCGYLGGKLSYMRVCQEKFKQLENSPLGEALRLRRPVSPEHYPQTREFSSVPYSSPFETSRAAEAPLSSMYSGDNRGTESSRSVYEPVPFSSSMNESTPTGITDSVPQEPGPSLEASPKKKGITYDELRNRNRELYEAGITQKSELPSRSPQERLSKKEVKVNKYGDAWEE
ncbi:PREDICTED: OCIA domain-containing protein 1 isoform X2 [Gekko japonicus]|uniref:OCIA domain-containing protein 1 n=1 Tax=Gekko japonicus TaxID=146911 RepID=A0ABM1K3S1_GEKJA|nr:PREDICTED: OCIA domain-containing protein 1 isoform X1 [Gekko japonicus]XP_015268358.1 PREDICTED: OCIA domain-containing protein 1 isoform X2 [Gekko japonicus]